MTLNKWKAWISPRSAAKIVNSSAKRAQKPIGKRRFAQKDRKRGNQKANEGKSFSTGCD